MSLPPLVTIAHRTGMVMLAAEQIKMVLMMAVNARRTSRTLEQALSDGGAPSDLVSALSRENADDKNRWLFEHVYAISEGRERPTVRPPAPFERVVNDAWAASALSQ